MAEEHATNFIEYRAVIIKFESERGPVIEHQLRCESERKERLAWQIKQEKECLKQIKKQNELQKNHPRCGEWGNISKEELEELV